MSHSGCGWSATAEPARSRDRELLIDRHTDGAYAVLRLAADCPGPGPLHLRYALLFDRDPSHRGLLSVTAGGTVSSAVLSPEAPEVTLDPALPPASGLPAFFVLGFEHISHGLDHLLFLLVILLPLASGQRVGGDRPALAAFKILTAFTVAHGLSLALAVLGVVALPSRLVESAIAATIVLAALDNLRPFLPGRRWQVAFGFGLIHGLGFASALGPDRAAAARARHGTPGLQSGYRGRPDPAGGPVLRGGIPAAPPRRCSTAGCCRRARSLPWPWPDCGWSTGHWR